MSNIALMAWITLKEGIRNKSLYGIFAFGLLLLFANLIFTGMFSFELGKVAVDVGLSVVSFSGLVIILFLGIHLLANDLERKTIYLVLSRPVSRFQYVVGKYLGLSLTIFISSAVLGGMSVVSVLGSTWNVPGALPSTFSWGIFFLGLVYITFSLCIVMALAMLWVCVTTNSFTAILLTLFSYFIGQNVENVKNIILRNESFSSNQLLVAVVEWGSWLFPNLAAFDLKETAAYGLPIDATYLLYVALYGISYIVLCLFISILVFQRRELG